MTASSYCRACASKHERDRRRMFADEINKRRRDRYTPDKGLMGKLREYGLDRAGFDRMMEKQGGACAICGTRDPVRRLHIDHDHSCCPERFRSCGKCIRGLLCSNCNNGLGRFMDDARRLKRAAAYLGQHIAKARGES